MLRMRNDLGCPVLAAVLLSCACSPSLHAQETATGDSVTISTRFPGGNILVNRHEGNAVHLAPDLRGDSPWFYWYFEATALQPGRVRFVFPEKVAGFKNGAIGFQGPAISMDAGKTWKWMGTKTVEANTFSFDFTKKGEVVRFAVTIPYLQSNLDAFLAKHAKNLHLKKSMLTRSRGGRDVELLQVGTPGPERAAVIITCRHHATETMASYLLEGFLEEALADSPEGQQFRQRYVLYVVPFVDKDGVENGDQGKNRKPHDHNRDYIEKNIYPEVQAIMQLQKKIGFRYSLDLHCPTLVMEDHQVMYFLGAKKHPAHNFANVTVFAERIKSNLPKSAPYGPLVWLREAKVEAPTNSHYFSLEKDMVMSATLEFPFAPPGKATDPTSCRRYGRAILQAFIGCKFTTG